MGPADRGPSRMVIALCAAALTLGAGAARADLGVWVAAPGEPFSADSARAAPAPRFAPGDTLVAAFGLTGLFDQGNETLGEGIPATLTLVVDLWRERGGWWDALVHSQSYTYRFRRDVWSGAYEIVDPDLSTARLTDRDALRLYLERVHEIPLGPASRFEASSRYYLTVKAVLQPLNLDDLEAVDAWLSGDVTRRSGNGGLLGVPKALAGFVIDLSGLGDVSALGRSLTFVPRPGR